MLPQWPRLGQALMVNLAAEHLEHAHQFERMAAPPSAVMRAPVARLLAQKEEMIRRFERNPGANERADIEQLLAKIDAALSLLDNAGPGDPP